MIQTNAQSEKVIVRLPDGWRRALKISAAENGRTMNAEIVQRLRPTIEVTDAQQ